MRARDLHKTRCEDKRAKREQSQIGRQSARRLLDHGGRPHGPWPRPCGTKAAASGGRSLHAITASAYLAHRTIKQKQERPTHHPRRDGGSSSWFGQNSGGYGGYGQRR